jgi:predicted glycosyltransferase
MNVSYYCQHVLGIGHFHRSMEICKALSQKHAVTLILGGPPVEVNQPRISVLQLPGLKMDETFHNMTPCQTDQNLEQVKATRKEILFHHFHKNKPDVFITELYPFGRKAFRFELDPILKGIQEKTLSSCLCYCSIRDILVEKTNGKEKFERRVIKTLGEYFHGILIHADPTIVTLDTTFDLFAEIDTPIHYTGFVAKQAPKAGHEQIRRQLNLQPNTKLIVASIGGGNVGAELLHGVVAAFNFLQLPQTHLQLFCGLYCDDEHYERLKQSVQENISVDRFTTRFPAWLEAADLSISMAGYNTCMNLIRAGVPSLVLPFKQNREQQLRAERLSKKAPISILDENALHPPVLAERIRTQLQKDRLFSDIMLDGATETARQVEIWHKEHQKP